MEYRFRRCSGRIHLRISKSRLVLFTPEKKGSPPNVFSFTCNNFYKYNYLLILSYYIFHNRRILTPIILLDKVPL